MEISMYIVWPLLLILAIIIELNTSMQIGWAASIASGFALLAHILTKGDPAWIEFAVFAIVWAILWIILFGFIGKWGKKIHDKDDGFLAYIDKVVVANKGNEKEFGQIKINDKYFRFKSEDKIIKGDKVKINSIKGVTFFVTKGDK